MSAKITDDVRDEVISFYQKEPMSIQRVCDKFGLCGPTVAKILRSCGVKTWPKFKVYSPRFVEDYFSEINTESKAYFLGLMITDGNIYNRYKSVTHPANINITLNESDRYILEKFKDALRVNKRIAKDGRGCCQFVVFSDAMADDLAKYGVTPNKSLTVKFPTNIPDDMYCHFIRGVFDGDGSASFYARPNRKVHTRAIRFCSGSKDFLNGMVCYLSKAAGVSRLNLYKEKENLWSVAYRGNADVESMIRYMYDGAWRINLKLRPCFNSARP